MREIIFIKKNKEKWLLYEDMLNNKTTIAADELSDLYVQIINDLSYANTFYPNSSTANYLNTLAAQTHHLIYKNKKENPKRLLTFWTKELPLLMYEVRKTLLLSFIIFSVSFLIGWLSSAYDDSFVRLILGDTYVNMTIDNIEKGDPMAVYKEEKEINMFFGITLNNIFVSFYTFILGIFFSFGTIYLLLSNGIMLGSFMYFFKQYNVFTDALKTVWIHGTLEISAIVIAGCAGLLLGSSFVFPGTYSRLKAFQNAALKGVKIITGLIPVFILAGFLESFVTRHTEMPLGLSLFIIFGSLLFVIGYFIIYPYLLHQKIKKNGNLQRTRL
jgi:uncharacterized membrane protein SpoIIM required for sporulation